MKGTFKNDDATDSVLPPGSKLNISWNFDVKVSLTLYSTWKLRFTLSVNFKVKVNFIWSFLASNAADMPILYCVYVCICVHHKKHNMTKA